MGKKRKKEEAKRRRHKGKALWLVVLIAAAIGFSAWGWLKSTGPRQISNSATSVSSGYIRVETGTPLSPVLFVGKTAASYQVAHEIPDVLDQIYCYCQCDRHMGHKSLLSCFVDSHAAT